MKTAGKSTPSIAVIGAGKMGGAIVKALISSKVFPASAITGSVAPSEDMHRVAAHLGIKMERDNCALVKGRDIVILAVKPQSAKKILQEIGAAITGDQLLISIMAARSTGFIEEHLGKEIPVVRAMPNTPLLVGEGMTVLCRGKFATKAHLETARAIFASVGLVETIDNEELMDAVTALSGAGPAYAYIMIEALAEGGVYTGIPRALSTRLAAQSLLGAAKMVIQRGEHPALLKDEVTTPAGVTIDGIMELEDGGIRVTLIKAVDKATRKSKEISL
ncbi:MAG: pyrroline-5-carboxylate reductase [Myxococcota bacterium]